MIVYHKKNSYFVPDEDANLIPMGSYVLKDNEVVYVDNLNELVASEPEVAVVALNCKVTDTLCEVEYKENEINIYYPADAAFVQQNGNGDKNKYYFGVKVYAPNNDINGFKEDLKAIIEDQTMYKFEDNAYAGTDATGKYSIIWLPAATLNEDGTWRYFGAASTNEHKVGWDYNVEWYQDETLVSKGSMKINLVNEDCR